MYLYISLFIHATHAYIATMYYLYTHIYKYFIGYFYGEVVIPLSKLKQNQTYEDWFPLSKRKSINHDVTGSIMLRLLLEVCLC